MAQGRFIVDVYTADGHYNRVGRNAETWAYDNLPAKIAPLLPNKEKANNSFYLYAYGWGMELNPNESSPGNELAENHILSHFDKARKITINFYDDSDDGRVARSFADYFRNYAKDLIEINFFFLNESALIDSEIPHYPTVNNVITLEKNKKANRHLFDDDDSLLISSKIPLNPSVNKVATLDKNKKPGQDIFADEEYDDLSEKELLDELEQLSKSDLLRDLALEVQNSLSSGSRKSEKNELLELWKLDLQLSSADLSEEKILSGLRNLIALSLQRDRNESVFSLSTTTSGSKLLELLKTDKYAPFAAAITKTDGETLRYRDLRCFVLGKNDKDYFHASYRDNLYMMFSLPKDTRLTSNRVADYLEPRPF